MTDESPKRPYRMTRRAEAQEHTHLRITEAAVDLHGSVGPARTSMSAVAQRAGVRRSTLYRHFPDETALFAACSAHWLAANPMPDLSAWSAVADPDERLRTALEELYAYYAGNEGMFENLVRDEEVMAVVKERFALFRRYLAAAQDTLLRGRRARGAARRRTRAAIGHAIAFSTWRSLVREQGLDPSDAARLAAMLVALAAQA